MEIYRTAIPMRRFEHAAASRQRAESVVVRVRWSGGQAGWGETLPRDYVTGETLDTVVADLQDVFWPAVRQGRVIGEIPTAVAGGRCINAAACAMDLAWFDAWWEAGEGRAPEALGGCGRPAGRIATRVSGVLGSTDPARTARALRLMRWYGLDDFKLKLGLGAAVDRENLRVVSGKIARSVRRGRCTLRVDVNGGWPLDEVPQRVADLKRYGVCVVEQPVYCGAGELAELARRCELPLMANESLLTDTDARALLAAGAKVWWNIRLSKNGGLRGAARLCRMAAANGIPFVVGCMVGESSILSAAQRRLLQCVPLPRFVEGNYGRFLLADDLTRRSLRFGYGGRLKVLKGAGLGIEVDASRLARRSNPVTTLEG